jgi:hypothetical protein
MSAYKHLGSELIRIIQRMIIIATSKEGFNNYNYAKVYVAFYDNTKIGYFSLLNDAQWAKIDICTDIVCSDLDDMYLILWSSIYQPDGTELCSVYRITGNGILCSVKYGVSVNREVVQKMKCDDDPLDNMDVRDSLKMCIAKDFMDKLIMTEYLAEKQRVQTHDLKFTL